MRLPDFVRRLLPKEEVVRIERVYVSSPDGYEAPGPVTDIDSMLKEAHRLRSQSLNDWGFSRSWAFWMSPDTFNHLRYEAAKSKHYWPPIGRDHFYGYPVRVDIDIPDGVVRAIREPKILRLPR